MSRTEPAARRRCRRSGKHRASILPAILFTALLTVCQTASGYTHLVQRQSGDFVRLRWATGNMPVRFRINEQTNPSLPNLTAGSDPLAAIERALGKWPSVSSVTFSNTTDSGIASAGRDNANIISFADTRQNREVFEMTGGALGVTLFFFRGPNLTEADVLFNPDILFTTTAETDAQQIEQHAFDVESVATHELGHAIGMHHSGVESAAMWALQSMAARRLDPDDISGARALYPVDGGFARIDGNVNIDGIAAFGAQVVAVHSDGTPVSGLTLSNGDYSIEALMPATYTVYVEPLDGPHTSVADNGCLRFSNMSGAGIYSDATLTTDFPTTYFGGNDSPTALTVDAGSSTTVDFALPAVINTLNPTLVGAGTVASFSLTGAALDLARGSQQRIAIAGPGLQAVEPSAIAVSGEDLSIDPGSLQRVTSTCGGQALPTLLIDVSVQEDAAPGGRTIRLQAGSELSTFTGALRVRVETATAPPTPSPTPTATITPSPTRTVTRTRTQTFTPTATRPVPCIGDCNADHHVTVDELVRAVAISLGTGRPVDCAALDNDNNGAITIDELIDAVNAATHTCIGALNRETNRARGQIAEYPARVS